MSPETQAVYNALKDVAVVPSTWLEHPALWARGHGITSAELAQRVEPSGGRVSGGSISPRLNALMRRELAVNDPLTARWAAL
jgi:hypothetical protein